MNYKKIMDIIKGNCNDSLLRNRIIEALSIEDTRWYQEKLRNDIRNYKLDRHKEKEVIDRSVDVSRQMASKIQSMYNGIEPKELAKALHISIVNRDDEINTHFLYLAFYDSNNRKIIINNVVLSIIQDFICIHNLNNLTSERELLDSILYHEIFHALEDVTPGIYTRSKMIKKSLMGFIKYQRSLNGASEVGAIHFSKIMSNIKYSPCVFEKYLLLISDQISLDYIIPNVGHIT